ncbi:DKNYY domain-containing protein [Spirosoma gilvum]
MIRQLIASAGLLIISLFLKGCGPSSRKGYRIENDKVVLYRGWPATRYLIEEADPESFVAINDECGKDKAHVFYLGRILPEADPATFEFLGSAYSRDKRNGYSEDKLISNDGPHFNIVPNPAETPANVTAEGIPYAHDRYRVYKGTFIIEGTDPATFVFVPMFNGYYLTHDKQGVYFRDRPIEGADGATFQRVSAFHFKDDRHVWGIVLGRDIYWSPIEKANLASFTGVGKYYAKDKQHVYYENEIIADADPATFEETGYLTAKDKHGNYQSGRRSTN